MRMLRGLGAFTVIFGLLVLSFYGTFLIARSSGDVAMVFPTRNCKQVTSAYGNQLEKFAVEDFEYVEEHDFNAVVSQGPYQCFCQDMIDNNYDKLG